MKPVALTLALLLLVGCSPEDDGPGAAKSPAVSAEVLVDFDPYSFVTATDDTEANLGEYIRSRVPEGATLIGLTVRSVEEDGDPVPAEVVAAAFDRGRLQQRKFYLEMLNSVASPNANAILDQRAVSVVSEGTAAVATFMPDDVLVYLVGPELGPLKEITAGLLRLNEV